MTASALSPIPLTDVASLRFGHWTDAAAGTGCTVIVAPDGATGGVDVRGGAPASRETDLLRPENTVQQIHAVCLSGGSAFGLEAASGVARELEERGIGLDTGAALVPIGLGLIAGVLGLSRIVDYFFRTHRRSAYWCIMGITVGSVVTVVVQALQGMESGMVPATIVCIVAGLVFGYVLSRVSSRYAKETIETEPA